MAHELRSWDWRELTFRAVAVRAGVSERTIYRHFATERQLHDAVMRRLEAEAGVSYEGIELEAFAAVAARIFATFPSFASFPSFGRQPATTDDTATASSNERRHQAVLNAVAQCTASWPEADTRMAAAMLDVLWTPTFYEHLMTNWGMNTETVTRSVTWALNVLIDAIRAGKRPTSAR